MNSHLGRVTCRIGDLYTDLRDGRMLIRLLEVLSGEQLVSITHKRPLSVPDLTQTLSVALTLHHKSGGETCASFLLSLKVIFPPSCFNQFFSFGVPFLPQVCSVL